MGKCFLSYSHHDEAFAKYVWALLRSWGVDVFMAKVSLAPGEDWSCRILDELRARSHIVFVASREACESEFVPQELGGAVCDEKEIIPLVYSGTTFPGLPGWVRGRQALDLRGLDQAAVVEKLYELAETIRGEDEWLPLKVLGAIGALVLVNRAAGKSGPKPVDPQPQPGEPGRHGV